MTTRDSFLYCVAKKLAEKKMLCVVKNSNQCIPLPDSNAMREIIEDIANSRNFYKKIYDSWNPLKYKRFANQAYNRALITRINV